jgi:hypothetical protein
MKTVSFFVTCNSILSLPPTNRRYVTFSLTAVVKMTVTWSTLSHPEDSGSMFLPNIRINYACHPCKKPEDDHRLNKSLTWTASCIISHYT